MHIPHWLLTLLVLLSLVGVVALVRVGFIVKQLIDRWF